MPIQDGLILIKTYQNIQLIKANEILCCISSGRAANIIMVSDECLKTTHNLKDLTKKLEKFRFVRCHAKYLVNLGQPIIYDAKNREIELLNKQKIAVAKDRKAYFTKILNGKLDAIKTES